MPTFGFIIPVTFQENPFGQQSPTCKSRLPMQLGCMRSCEPPDCVQMHNFKELRVLKNSGFLTSQNGCFWTVVTTDYNLQKSLFFFTHTDVF